MPLPGKGGPWTLTTADRPLFWAPRNLGWFPELCPCARVDPGMGLNRAKRVLVNVALFGKSLCRSHQARNLEMRPARNRVDPKCGRSPGTPGSAGGDGKAPLPPGGQAVGPVAVTPARVGHCPAQSHLDRAFQAEAPFLCWVWAQPGRTGRAQRPGLAYSAFWVCEMRTRRPRGGWGPGRGLTSGECPSSPDWGPGRGTHLPLSAAGAKSFSEPTDA